MHYHQQTIELIDNIENGRFTEGPLERICQVSTNLLFLYVFFVCFLFVYSSKDQDCLSMLIDILYSVGAILLLVDICLPGKIVKNKICFIEMFVSYSGLMRERLVVAYVRQNNCVHLILQNEMLQKLCQRTGFVAGTRTPQGIPKQGSNF